MSIPDTSGHSLWDFDSSFERPLRCLAARAAHGVMACCLRSPKSPSRKLNVTWRTSPIVGDDVLVERYKVPPHMLFYSEDNGAASQHRSWKRYQDEMGDYKAPPIPPPEGQDEARVPFRGANTDWEQHKEDHKRSVHKRYTHTHETLETENYPWRTPEGDTEYSVKEMEKLCKEILNGTHFIAQINQKETLRCINVASMNYRDTLRDLDEGDCCSDTSDAPNDPPKIAKRKAKQRSLAVQGCVPT